jgi:hypothetical protein
LLSKQLIRVHSEAFRGGNPRYTPEPKKLARREHDDIQGETKIKFVRVLLDLTIMSQLIEFKGCGKWLLVKFYDVKAPKPNKNQYGEEAIHRG